MIPSPFEREMMDRALRPDEYREPSLFDIKVERDGREVVVLAAEDFSAFDAACKWAWEQRFFGSEVVLHYVQHGRSVR